jgi:regulator of replication initiation timing
MRRIALVLLLSATTVVITDLTFQSTLLHTLWPVILTPADGAITNAPVTVRWEGPQPMLATLRRGGRRQALGLRPSPFEIDASRFRHPGQYAIELQSPKWGGAIKAERRFLVRRPPEPEPTPVPEEKTENTDTAKDLDEIIRRLRSERDRIEAENQALYDENTKLRLDNRDLSQSLDDLHDQQEQTDSRLAAAESQQAELMQQHMAVLQQNQLLRNRIQTVPACTTWGYLSRPRAETMPSTRRIFVVSNGQGVIFRNELQCELTRRNDRTAASPCVCVGTPWGE